MASPEESLRALSERVSAVLSQKRLTVVLLGPGVGAGDNPDFDKRRRIQDDVRASYPQDLVYLPEDAVTEGMIAQVGVGRSEAELVRMSDIVIALVPPGGRASGVLGEIMDFVRMPGFMERLWIFRPDDRAAPGARLSYMERRVSEIVDETRFVDYPSTEWQECTFIRSRCAQALDKERRRQVALDLVG